MQFRMLFFWGIMMQVLSAGAQSGNSLAVLPGAQSANSLAILPGGTKALTLLPGEKWWGGAVTEGQLTPFEVGYSLDLNEGNRGNQAAPLLLSSAGRWVWSEQPFAFVLRKDSLILSKNRDSIFIGQAGQTGQWGQTGQSGQPDRASQSGQPDRASQSGQPDRAGQAGQTLAGAYREVSGRFFPASGKMPDSLLIMRPQYNTWIELIYNQNQSDILKYSRAVIDAGFPPGVFMIDDNWFDAYGRFRFRKDRFPDASDMIRQLHHMGFKVMVWVSPFISPDNEVFREADSQRIILYDNKGQDTWQNAKDPALIHWWNGYSAVLDFTNPAAVRWFDAKLRHMVDEYGIDGFKFDAGDAEFYPSSTVSYQKANPNEQCMLWGLFGLEYPLNEYRAMWKRGGQPLAERLRDKYHTFEDLQKLVPHTLMAGLLGYPFVCPDMIGGGDFSSFTGNKTINQDLIVRSAQCQALMPMMQFSVAPWRVLDSVHLAAVKDAVALRGRFAPRILQLAGDAARSGTPIVRSLEYVFPHQGLENVKDEFMLGDDWLVAPVLTASPRRKIVFPNGRWKDAQGHVFKGPGIKEWDVPLNELPWFELVR